MRWSPNTRTPHKWAKPGATKFTELKLKSFEKSQNTVNAVDEFKFSLFSFFPLRFFPLRRFLSSPSHRAVQDLIAKSKI